MLEALKDPLFYQTNLIFLIWTIGIGINALLDLMKGKKGIESFWNTEEFLFGKWFVNKRMTVGTNLFLLAVVMLQIKIFFLNSLIRESFPQVIYPLTLVFDNIIGLLLLVKMIFGTKYSGRELLIAWPAFFAFRWTFLNHHDYWIMISILFLFAAKDINFRRTLKACMWASIASIASVMIGVTTGVISAGKWVMTEERVRYSLGYGSPNLLGVYLLAVLVMYVCLKGAAKLKWYDFLCIGLVGIFCDVVPDSRGTALGILLLLLGLIIAKCMPKLFDSKVICALLSITPLLGYILSFLGCYYYNEQNKIMLRLNQLLTGRIALGNAELHNGSIPIAGRMVTDHWIDSFYIKVILELGPVVSLFLIGVLCALIWKLCRLGYITEAVCVLTFVAHGMIEAQIMWSCVNVTLLLAVGVLYNVSNREFPSFERNKHKEILR